MDPTAKPQKIAKGLPASPGAAVGKAVFTAAEAEEMAGKGERVVLVRLETSPEDIGGMHAAQGILTARGGMTSHAAVVARGMGKPCVAGSGDITVYEEHGYFFAKDLKIQRGEYITLDGSTGEVMLGEAKLIKPELSGDFATLMSWADKCRKIGVRANADTPQDAKVTMQFGGEGIGLTRTEHMFFEGDRIDAVREMILANDLEGRKKALAKLLPMQKQDFKGILGIMGNLPVTIRTLDPPLHEFLPKTEADIQDLSQKTGIPAERIKAKVDSLHEFNPMLGFRGCRLGIEFPEITEMQAQAIFEAACELRKEGKNPFPEVMIPLVGTLAEFQLQKDITERVAKETQKKYGVKVKYMIGTMIEIPRACIAAGEIASQAEFFSFGTNDLTQTTLALSRDDAGKFLPTYVDRKIYKEDPFVSIDQEGVGEMMTMGVERGRKVTEEPGARHLRRARRRPGVGHLLPPDRPGLRELLALPDPGSQAGRGPREPEGQGKDQGDGREVTRRRCPSHTGGSGHPTPRSFVPGIPPNARPHQTTAMVTSRPFVGYNDQHRSTEWRSVCRCGRGRFA